MDDLLKRLDAGNLPLITTGWGTYPDVTSIAGTMREAAARIRELEAQLAAQSPAEVWRRAMGIAHAQCIQLANSFDNDQRHGGAMDCADAIRDLG